MTSDYVIFHEIHGYAHWDKTYGGWMFGTLLQATSHPNRKNAQQQIDGFIMPSGRVAIEKDPELEGCVVRRRTVYSEDC